MKATERCFWVTEDPLYLQYHDQEWGVPVVDETRLFEKLCLEGFQAGLSWLTILRKRENFRRAFAEFDLQTLARWGEKDVQRLLRDAGIVRHEGKIRSTLQNARRALELQAETGSLAAHLWSFEPKARRPKGLTAAELKKITTTAESVALSRDLRSRGWTFVGPTTAYALMQAMGMVNDHTIDCFRHAQVEKLHAGFMR
ncbi:MAG TPA: DNA-3-methyladenine glycosylase I [Myxococcaceae bacterium]|nr:DNA-3-methyladenine glycosylase I [Myxococcaceae bacterium]